MIIYRSFNKFFTFVKKTQSTVHCANLERESKPEVNVKIVKRMRNL